MQQDSQKTPEIELKAMATRIVTKPHYTASPLRWYILVMHSLVGLGQCLVYSSWGPIAISAEKAFGLTQTDIALLPNWYNISYFIAIFPTMWLVQNTGFRAVELMTAGLCAAGASIRCLNFGPYPDQYRYIIHLGHFINGLASPLPWMGCTYISALWFPPHERALATSLGLAASGIGTALSNVVSPGIVYFFAPEVDGQEAAPEQTYFAIRNLLYIEALYCQIVLVLVILYFPSRPVIPPSFTAGEERTPFFKGLKALLTNTQTWIMLGVYAVSSSVFASWQQFLSIFVSPVMGEVEAGWLGFTIQILGIVSGPVLSATSPFWIEKHSKLVCGLCLALGCVSIGVMAVSALVFKETFSSLLMWVTMICGGITLTAAQPIWWEMSCDASYPVAESVVSGVFTLGNCVISYIYFFLYMFEDLGTDWTTWSFLAAEIICIPALIFYKPSTNRSRLDALPEEEQQEVHRRNTARDSNTEQQNTFFTQDPGSVPLDNNILHTTAL